MIDPKTLHIGSHILVNGVRVEIECITNDSQIGYYLPNYDDWEACSPDRDWVEPIPITPELLTELGFEMKEEFGSVSAWKKDNLIVKIIGERKAISFVDRMHSLEIRYLHELEYLYYLIYGQELIKE